MGSTIYPQFQIHDAKMEKIVDFFMSALYVTVMIVVYILLFVVIVCVSPLLAIAVLAEEE